MKYMMHLRSPVSSNDTQEEKKSYGGMEKKEKLLSFGIYALIIIITISLMLIIFNLVIKV